MHVHAYTCVCVCNEQENERDFVMGGTLQITACHGWDISDYSLSWVGHFRLQPVMGGTFQTTA